MNKKTNENLPEKAENEPESENPQDNVRERIVESIGPLIEGEDNKARVVEVVTSMIAEERFAGPVPHPTHIAQYEAVCPGSADRLIAMAEEVNSAQIDVTKKMQQNDAEDRRLGQYFGFGALFVIVLGTVILALADKMLMSGALLSVGAAGTVARFVNGRQSSD